MTEPLRQPGPRLDAWIKIVAGMAGAPFAAAGVLAGFDRSGGSWLEIWLSLAFLLSLILLFLAVIPLIFLAEKEYFRSASSSGSGLIVLGGGIALVAVLLLPLGKLAGPYLDDLRYTGAAVQAIVLFSLWAGLLGFNLLRLHAPGREPIRGPLVSALLLLPVTGLAALWLVALGKAMLVYGTKTTDAWWVKALLELANGVYGIALLIAACMLFYLFPGLISKRSTPARHQLPDAPSAATCAWPCRTSGTSASSS